MGACPSGGMQFPCDAVYRDLIDHHPPLASRPLTVMCTGRYRNNAQFYLRNEAMDKCSPGGAWSDFAHNFQNHKELTHDIFLRSLTEVSLMSKRTSVGWFLSA